MPLPEDEIILKSNGSDLRLVVAEGLSRQRVDDELVRVAEEAENVLKGSRVVLDFQGRVVDEALLQSVLNRLVWPTGMRLLSWITLDGASQNFLRRSGFTVGEPPTERGNRPKACRPFLLFRSLRSGQRVEHEGDVVIVGHVNDGAEVFALGNVFVWGRLQGLVHAGYEGDDGARVVVAHMEALQVRIGRRVGYMDRGAAWWGNPVVISVDGESVLVDAFSL